MVINWAADAIILHIPHASTVLPSEVEFLLGHEALAYEMDAMTDHHTNRQDCLYLILTRLIQHLLPHPITLDNLNNSYAVWVSIFNNC